MTENINRAYYMRIHRLLLENGTKLLCKCFKSRFPSVKNYSNILEPLRNVIEKKLIPRQRDILFPSGSRYTGDLSDLDISALYILLRNMGNLPPHSKGWGNEPEESDRSMSANIERIKLFRNQVVGHSSIFMMHEGDFNRTWTILKQSMIELGEDEQTIDEMLVTPLDPQMHEQLVAQGIELEILNDALATYLNHKTDATRIPNAYSDTHAVIQEELTAQSGSINVLQEVAEENKEITKEMQLSICHLENRKTHLKAIETEEIKKWRTSVEKFVVTKTAEKILGLSKENQVVLIKGKAGSGKSITAYYIAFSLEEKHNYTVHSVNEPLEIVTLTRRGHKQVFVCDDAFGKFNLKNYAEEVWTRSKIYKHFDSESQQKLILVTRSGIKVNDLIDKLCISPVICDLELSEVEIRDVGKVYLPNNIIDNLTATTLLLYPFMPLLFYLYYKKRTFNAILSNTLITLPLGALIQVSEFLQAKHFFEHPKEILEFELKSMEKQSFLSLALLVMFGNKVEKTVFNVCSQEHASVFRSLYEESGIESYYTRKTLQECMSKLKNTYLIETGHAYKAIHDKMFDMICKYFGEEFPCTLINYGSANVLANRVLVESFYRKDANLGENVIILPKKYGDHFLSRMFTELKKGNYFHVFGNLQSRFKLFRSKFVQFLNYQDQSFSLNNTDVTGATALHVSAIRGYFGYVKYIVYFVRRDIGAFYFPYTESVFMQDKYGRTPLLCACQSGRVKIIKLLLKHGAIISERNGKNKATALHVTSALGHISATKTLLKHGAPVNMIMPHGATPLYSACDANNILIAKILLNNGAYINQKSCNKTPLYHACCQNLPAIAKFLLEEGADVNTLCTDGLTSLHVACKANLINLVKMLIEKGSIINFQSFSGQTPLHLSRGLHVIRFLLSHGADPNLRNNEGKTPLHEASIHGDNEKIKLLLKSGASVNDNGPDGMTALHLACTKGHSTTVVTLLDSGADINRTGQGFDAIYWAIKGGSVDTLSRLMIWGAKLNNGTTVLHTFCKDTPVQMIQKILQEFTKCEINTLSKIVNEQDNNGLTPLHIACQRGILSLAEFCIKCGSDGNIPDINGQVPLHIASIFGEVEILNVLLNACCSHINNVDSFGFTALHYACCLDDPCPSSILLKNGASANILSLLKDTPLHMACAFNNFEHICELLRYNADPNIANNMGLRPLHLSCIQNNQYITDILLKSDAQINCTISISPCLTPLHFACHRGNYDVVLLLLKYKPDVNSRDDKGFTPLSYAYIANKMALKIINVLIAVGADLQMSFKDGDFFSNFVGAVFPNVNQPDICGGTEKPMYKVSELNCHHIIDVMAKHDIDVNQTLSDEWTPLHTASFYRSLDAVKCLLYYGANVNCTDNHGRTPLHIACLNDDIGVVVALVEGGADMHLKTLKHNIPFDIAMQNRRMQVVSVLIQFSE